MLYEVHITVASDDTDRWQDFCRRMGMKPLLIELAEGEHSRQLMCEATFTGSESGARDFADDLEGDVRANGYEILRTKLECPLAPRREKTGTVYFECHIKLVLTDEQLPIVAQLCRDHGFSASSEVFSRTPEKQKWYLTERYYKGEVEEVREKFRLALARARERLPVKAMDSERVLTDSNPEIDKGWVK